jgi:hypothetical protein
MTDNIKMKLNVIGHNVVNCIPVDQDRNQWQVLVTIVINFRSIKDGGREIS